MVQYANTNANEFFIPALTGVCNTSMLNVSGVDANSLYAQKLGDDWIVIPNNTTQDDVTYNFSLTATMSDGRVYPGDDYVSLLLHVGCPSAASNDSYSLVDNAPSSVT